MEMVLVAGALVAAGYLIAQEVKTEVAIAPRKRVADYYVAGALNEDPTSVLANGMRLLELHVGSDMQDRPVLLPSGDKFEPVCVTLLNKAFPSKDPFILSLVFHTDTTVTLNAVAKSLRETVHRHLVPPTPNLAEVQVDTLADKLSRVSGPGARGSDGEPFVTLSWGDSGLRRLDYARALHPRDPEELKRFAAHNLVLVVPDKSKGVYAGDNDIVASGCQWNLAGTGAGFIERAGV